jgi:hypothetical protein
MQQREGLLRSREYAPRTTACSRLVMSFALATVFAACGGTASSGSGAATVHDYRSLAGQLQAGGATVVSGGAIHHPFLSVPGQVLLVNNQTVEVFEYASANALTIDTAAVGKDGCIGTIGGGMDDPWTGPPHFFRSEGVLVIYVGSDASVLRALIAAMGPQFKGK